MLLGGALIALTGSLSGFWQWTVGILTQYASSNWAFVLSRAKDSVVPFVVDMAVLWVAAIAWAVRWKRLDSGQRVIVAWLVLSVVGSLAGGHLSWHYFIQVMGPLALLSALAVDAALQTQWRRKVAWVVAIGVAVPAVGWFAFDAISDPLTYDFGPPVPRHEQVAAYIRSHTNPGDRVFVWGDWPALYVESDRVMASRFPGFLRGFAWVRTGFGASAEQLGYVHRGLGGAESRPGAQPADHDRRHGRRGLERLFDVSDAQLPGARRARRHPIPPDRGGGRSRHLRRQHSGKARRAGQGW